LCLHNSDIVLNMKCIQHWILLLDLWLCKRHNCGQYVRRDQLENGHLCKLINIKHSPLLNTILSYFHPPQILTTCIIKIQVNIILSFTSCSTMWIFYKMFLHEHLVCFPCPRLVKTVKIIKLTTQLKTT